VRRRFSCSLPVACCLCPVVTMKYKTHNEQNIGVDMSSLMGCVDTDYHSLLNAFGEPADGCDKTDAQWKIKFDDGTVATIYNWKSGHNYCGLSGKPVHRITHWNVGGYSVSALDNVRLAIKTHMRREQTNASNN